MTGVQTCALPIYAHREEIAARTKPKTPRYISVPPRRSIAGNSCKALLTHQLDGKPELEEESEVDLQDFEGLVELQDNGLVALAKI